MKEVVSIVAMKDYSGEIRAKLDSAKTVDDLREILIIYLELVEKKG